MQSLKKLPPLGRQLEPFSIELAKSKIKLTLQLYSILINSKNISFYRYDVQLVFNAAIRRRIQRFKRRLQEKGIKPLFLKLIISLSSLIMV